MGGIYEGYSSDTAGRLRRGSNEATPDGVVGLDGAGGDDHRSARLDVESGCVVQEQHHDRCGGSVYRCGRGSWAEVPDRVLRGSAEHQLVRWHHGQEGELQDG